jgi:hypothetical protein
MQKPSLGRVVLAKVDPSTNNGSNTAPAIITHVWSDTSINVRVMLDAFTMPEWRTSVLLVETEEEALAHEAANPYSRACYWPPRV